jgi:hypothetical protein
MEYSKQHLYHYLLQEKYTTENIYYAYNSMMYAINQMTIMDHDMDSYLSHIQVHAQKILLKIRNQIIDHHCDDVNSYCLVDIQYSDWESYRPYMSDTRCTYGIQMWYYYMKGIHHDLVTWCVSPYNMELFGEIVIRSLSSIFQIYVHLFPGRVRTAQLRSDITYVIMFTRTFRDVVPKTMLREMNQLLIRLLVYMTVLLSPVDILQHFLNTSEQEHVQNASVFATMFENPDNMRGIPVDIWEPTCIEYEPMFNPLIEYCTVNKSTFDHKYLANVSYDWRVLLDGWYVVGLSRNELASRVRGRCEYMENDYPPWTPQDAEALAMMDALLSKFVSI